MGEETGYPTSQTAEHELTSDSLLLMPGPPSWFPHSTLEGRRPGWNSWLCYLT